ASRDRSGGRLRRVRGRGATKECSMSVDSAPSPAPSASAPGGARKVMVATDGSEASLTAAKVAGEVFAGAEFLLVTVIDELEDPMADAGGFEGPAMDEEE